MYDQFNNQVYETNKHLDEIDNMLTQLAEAILQTAADGGGDRGRQGGLVQERQGTEGRPGRGTLPDRPTHPVRAESRRSPPRKCCSW